MRGLALKHGLPSLRDPVVQPHIRHDQHALVTLMDVFSRPKLDLDSVGLRYRRIGPSKGRYAVASLHQSIKSADDATAVTVLLRMLVMARAETAKSPPAQP